MFHRLYYTDQRSIYKLQLDPESGLPLGHVPSPVTVVGGIIQVEIWGRNLGHTFSDILAITVQSTHVCTSIVHVNASYVTCLVTDAAASPNEPTAAGWLASDITLRTTAGVAYGIALNAESIVASASYRPAITHVRFARHALAPYGLSLVISPSPDKSATDECISGQDVTLYWTNLVAGRHLSALQISQYTSVAAGGSLQRVRGDGLQLETLVGGLHQPRGLLSLSSLLKTEPSSFEIFNSSDYEMSYVSSGDENSPLPCKDASRTGYEYLVWQADQQVIVTFFAFHRFLLIGILCLDSICAMEAVFKFMPRTQRPQHLLHRFLPRKRFSWFVIFVAYSTARHQFSSSVCTPSLRSSFSSSSSGLPC